MSKEDEYDKVKKDLFAASYELEGIFNSVRKNQEVEAETFWDNLSYEDKCNAFHAVVAKIHKADIEDGRSYRGSIYDVFGFDLDMYTRGMNCGYMTIHNAICNGEEYSNMRNVTRLEVIDDTGRALVKYFKEDERMRFILQDDNRTLKIFVDNLDTTKLGS